MSPSHIYYPFLMLKFELRSEFNKWAFLSVTSSLLSTAYLYYTWNTLNSIIRRTLNMIVNFISDSLKRCRCNMIRIQSNWKKENFKFLTLAIMFVLTVLLKLFSSVHTLWIQGLYTIPAVHGIIESWDYEEVVTTWFGYDTSCCRRSWVQLYTPPFGHFIGIEQK